MSASHDSILNWLGRLEKDWPDDLWVWSAGGVLHVMQNGPDGQRQMTDTGGVDPSYTLQSFRIPSDGGDW